MTKEEIFEKCKNNRNLFKEKIFAKHFAEAYNEIISIDISNMSFQQKFYHWYIGNYIIPVCCICGKPVKFLNPILGYRKHCSVSCSRKDKKTQEKMYTTSLKKYGNYCNREKSAKSCKETYDKNKKEILEKTKKTKLEKYGDENYSNIEKRKSTCLKKYGVESYSKTDDFLEKTKKTKLEKYGDETYTNRMGCTKTMFKKYGVKSPFLLNKIKEKIKKTNLEKYGTANVFASDKIKEKIKKTNLEKYGTANVFASDKIKEKIKKTNLEKYGTANALQNNNIKEKAKQTCLEKYGASYPTQNKHVREKVKETVFKKYGVENISQSEEIKEKVKETCLEKYGVPYACMREEARAYSNDSKPNKRFANFLDENNISYEREFPLETYVYDFKVDNILIEINPTITHNSYLNIFGKTPIDKNYHLNKSSIAKKHGYNCIHVWDWDDMNKILNMLKPKETLYARKLVLKEVAEKECHDFLNDYHLQNTCKGQAIRYGLYKDGLLVMIMTFGKPRYNKNYELELLRLCSHKDYIIVGGAEKIFKYILDKFNPESIISYCDNSKFNGSVYSKLGFKKHKHTVPSKHWYNQKTKQHITDNFLRQRGFDQLFGAEYGKGTSNKELMLQYGFLPVFDCGQITFKKQNKNII